MNDPVERLSRALADRYRLERELGQGGMATVYLAEDVKHNPDGTRLFMVRLLPMEKRDHPQLVVVENFFGELNAKVPR